MGSMSVSVNDVLVALRDTALDERDKGDKFERLVLNLLRTEPEWVSRFSDVWLWSDWPASGTPHRAPAPSTAPRRLRAGLGPDPAERHLVVRPWPPPLDPAPTRTGVSQQARDRRGRTR
jgi:hypothetical protein